MTLIEQIQNLLRSVATDLISGGQFKEVVAAEDGRQIVYEFPLATGMAWGAKKSSYSSRFGELPNWVAMLHPIHRIRVCDLSLDAGKPLPQEIDKKINYALPCKGAVSERTATSADAARCTRFKRGAIDVKIRR